ncbi:MAG: TetR/AcrR family transcriptional regulator [Pirellulales bacterium]|nr:TetR/AcrR family transcriptional regulator [Pirellulales bacterium]
MPRLTAIRKQALDGLMKDALFEATVGVLNEHGVDGMTMDRVATAAGVAKASLYRYFRSKRDLVEFVYARIVDPIFEELERLAAAKQPAREKLSEQLRTFLEHVAKHAGVFKLLFEDDTAHGLLQSSERRTFDAASERLAAFFRQGISEGVFRPNDPLALANMYLGLCKGVLHGQPDLEHGEAREKIHRLILGTLLFGIATDAGRTG